MAELGNTYVQGNISAHKIYQNGAPIDDLYGRSLSINKNTISLLNGSGISLSDVVIPEAVLKCYLSSNITTKSTINISDTNKSNYGFSTTKPSGDSVEIGSSSSGERLYKW